MQNSGARCPQYVFCKKLCAAGLELKRNASFDGKRYPLVMPKQRVKGITYGPKGNKLVQDAAMEGKVTWHLYFILNLLGYSDRFAADHESLSNVEFSKNRTFLLEQHWWVLLRLH